MILKVGLLTQAQIAKNIYACGELEEDSTCSILEHMGNDGTQYYNVKYFNLDVILSVGYRVNSRNAIAFRRWANEILKEFLLKIVLKEGWFNMKKDWTNMNRR